MHRLIAVAVLASGGALLVYAVFVVGRELSAGIALHPAALAVMLIATSLASALGVWMVMTARRAWRQPSVWNIRQLYQLFTFMVFATLNGYATNVIRHVDPPSDFIQFFGPWLVAIPVAWAIHQVLRRWGFPEGVK